MSELKRTEIEIRIDIPEDDIAKIDPQIIKLLLKDKTTRGNILNKCLRYSTGGQFS